MATDPPGEKTLDERRFELDADLRRREMTLKENEGKKVGLSPTYATVAGALLTLIGGIAGAYISAQSTQDIESGKSLTQLQIEELKVKGDLELEKSKQLAVESLERKKFETSLILEAIKTPSREDAIRNLKFFVMAGFVSDPDGKISGLSDSSLPSISAPSPESLGRTFQSTGVIRVGGSPVCTGVAVSTSNVLTRGYCVFAGTFGFGDFVGPPSPLKQLDFYAFGESYPLRVMNLLSNNTVLLEIDSSKRLTNSLVLKSREPKLGESLYIVFYGESDSPNFRTCRVVASAPEDSKFQHDCETAPGSGGAIVIAASDDALLGMDDSADGQGHKFATKLSNVLSAASDLILASTLNHYQ